MDNSYCCVSQCNSRGCDYPRTSFHRFPNQKHLTSVRLREEWIRVLKIGKKVSKRMVVCGKHFQPSDFFPRGDGPLFRTKLKKNVVPSLNIPLTSLQNVEELNKQKEKSLIRLERREKRDRSKGQILADMSNMNDHAMPSTSGTCSLNDENTNSIAELTENEDVVLAAQVLLSLGENGKKDVATQVTTGDLVIPHSFLVKMTEQSLKSLTGIHSMSLLETFVILLQKNYGKSYGCHQMPLKHQIIMAFMRIKLDLPFSSLSALFECTATTCKSIFKDVLKHLAVHLKCAIPWLSKEEIMERIPKCFKLYSSTRVVLDCTEVSVTKTDCAMCRIKSYSQYKCNHTIKLMFGVSPSGLITFISPVYGGRTSDQQIFKQSGILQFVEPHEDAIMVDKGFNIGDDCAENFIEVFQPPFLRQKKQFSFTEATSNTSVARARVHVERMIQRIKLFKIFQDKMPWNTLPYINEIFIVCSGIANLGNPILADDKF